MVGPLPAFIRYIVRDQLIWVNAFYNENFDRVIVFIFLIREYWVQECGAVIFYFFLYLL